MNTDTITCTKFTEIKDGMVEIYYEEHYFDFYIMMDKSKGTYRVEPNMIAIRANNGHEMWHKELTDEFKAEMIDKVMEGYKISTESQFMLEGCSIRWKTKRRKK